MSITIFSAVRTEYFQVGSYCFWSPFPGEFIRQIKLILGWQNLCLTSVFVHRTQHDIFFATLWTAACQASLCFTISRRCSNSCPLSQWSHPSISPSVALFFSCLQSFRASGFFPMSHLFALGGWSIRASASVSVLPMNIQSWFPLGLTDFISLQSYGVSRVFSSTTIQRHPFFGTQPSLWSNSRIHTWLLEKHSFDYLGLSWQSDVSGFNTLSSCIGKLL